LQQASGKRNKQSYKVWKDLQAQAARNKHEGECNSPQEREDRRGKEKQDLMKLDIGDSILHRNRLGSLLDS